MKRTLLSRVLVLPFFLFACAAVVEATTFKALLVSIEKYELAPLDYAENDVGKLATLLMSRYDCRAEACIDTASSGTESAKRSIEKRIRDWCDFLHADDTAVLYLAGHGVKDAEGKLYLAMIDFNRNNFDTAAIPLEWIRNQFEKCDGKSKLILIDTCFAGSDKSVDFEQASIEEVNGAFLGMKGVATIASCRGDEKSWLWGEAKHSLFTYWLIEALKGHADSDGNQRITLDELIGYLRENVSWVARKALDKEQRPILLNFEAGKDFQLSLRAISFQKMIDDIAEQIDLQMRLEKFECIGVPEFTTGLGDKFEPEYGALPRWTAESLRRELLKKARSNRSGYEVLAETALLELFKKNGLKPDDLGTEKTKSLFADGKEVPLLVRGKLLFFSVAGMSLRAELLSTKGKIEIAQVGGSALLNCKEMALCGLSGKFVISDAASAGEQPGPEPVSAPTPAAPAGDGAPKPQEVSAPASASASTNFTPDAVHGLISPQQRQEVAQAVREQEQPHPMADPNCPFKVGFEVRPAGSLGPYVPRTCTIDGNQCYFAVAVGEEYAIRLRNDWGEPVFARVLVDGLNTLSQSMPFITKGAFVEEIGGATSTTSQPVPATGTATGGDTAAAAQQQYVQFAPRVDLDTARPWVVNPTSFQLARGRLADYQIPGFVDANRIAETLQRFQIVDADQSVAARAGYTEQIGMITIAFFRMLEPDPAKMGVSRNIGTGAGEAEAVPVEYYEGPMIPGDMLYVMNIRYMSPESFKSLQMTRPLKSVEPTTRPTPRYQRTPQRRR